MNDAIFEQICEALALMGLSQVIAAPVVTHACRTAGRTPETLTADDVPTLAGALRRSLRTYLSDVEIDQSLRRLQGVGASTARPITRDTVAALAAYRPRGSTS